MIEKLTVYNSETTDPYLNLATEEYLTFHTEPSECILFLWQNAHTVVIGRNQNCWKECHVTELENDGGQLARRLSGGGAVYHDLGNLNFTFCLRKAEADVDRQLQVIINAAARFGLDAKKSGRNDAIISDRKFSGNAFFDSHGFYYHHGCILINTNSQDLARYLNPSSAKLKAKGVDSVRARVVNLAELNPSVTTDSFRSAMIAAASDVYNLPATPLSVARLNQDEIKTIADRLKSREWKYGRKIPFTNSISRRFTWGEIEFNVKCTGDIIEDALLASDSMDHKWFEAIGPQFRGCYYNASAICAVLTPLLVTRQVPSNVIDDITSMLKNCI